MNDAHLHLVVNHFPILGTIFGFGILLTGILMKNNTVKNIAYALFVIAAVFALFSMNTGEGAEELVEDIPGVGKKVIHDHEEMAEKFSIVLYALGVIAMAGWYLNIKNHSKAKLVSFLALTVAAVGIYVGREVGTSGGEIRHTEIRADAATTSTTEASENEDE